MKLTKEPELYLFDSASSNLLPELIRDINKQTMLSPIQGPDILKLEKDSELCKTKKGYVYTTSAFNQLCKQISAGFGQFIPDLAGIYKKRSENPRKFSLDFALEIFNRLIQMRFDDKLLGVHAVLNTKDKTIDGFIGMKHKYLSNQDFYDQAEQALKVDHSTLVYAALYGRQMILRYKSRYDPIVVSGKDSYSTGLHLANSEITGASVRIALLLLRTLNNDCALGPYSGTYGGRIPHAGSGFARRTNMLMETMRHRLSEGAFDPLAFDALKATSLRVSTKDKAKRGQQLNTAMLRRKINLSIAKKIYTRAVIYGADETNIVETVFPEDVAEIIAGRTVYDYFAATIREARELPLKMREQLEQVAFSMLIGEMKI